MTDVIIPLGMGSIHEDAELRLALRLLKKFGKDVGRIFVVGEKWRCDLSDVGLEVHHIPAHDNWGERNLNMAMKVHKACVMVDDLSEEFFYMQDDHFLLKPVTLRNFPAYHEDCTLEERHGRTNDRKYAQVIITTAAKLAELGKPQMMYDVHTPMVMEKSKYISMISEHFPAPKFGYVLKSMYGNIAGVRNQRPVRDQKIAMYCTREKLALITKGRPCFSISDKAFGPELLIFIENIIQNGKKI